MRKLSGFMLALGLSLGSGSAFAQTFGTQGDAAFGGERLFGLTFSKVTTEPDGQPESEEDTTIFGFAWSGDGDLPTPHVVPRLAFDYFVIDGLSLGGTIAYASYSVEDEDNNEQDASTFLFSPRVGYAFMFNDTIGIWPRGGIYYRSFNVDDFGDGNGFGLNLEAMLVITPTPHFGFQVGPAFDFDFTGQVDLDAPNAPDIDQRMRTFGIHAGVFGWL
jgi:hypothetical protein